MAINEIFHHQFSNGIRLVFKQVPHSQIVHCGLMLDIGSRDEQPHQQGYAHFWEHMAFKGTKKRKSFHILNKLETVGGELNAYTTKEKICFHASLLVQHFEKAIDLLSDIAFHSIFPESQLEKERGVVLEEMAMYYDSLEDAIQDDFDTLVFPDHQLGANILGTTEHIQKLTRQGLIDFVDENLSTENVVVSVVGNLTEKAVLAMVMKYVATLPQKVTNRKRIKPEIYIAKNQQLSRESSQCHVAIGRLTFSQTDPRKMPLFMATNLLGGPGMNSRFNLSLREKYGLVYGIDAGFSPMTDTGIFSIFFATDPKNLKKALKLVNQEIEILIDKPLSNRQLHALKEQIKGQLAMAEESNVSFMLMMAKSMLDLNKIETLEEIFTEIDSVSEKDIQEISEDVFNPKMLSSLIFSPN